MAHLSPTAWPDVATKKDLEAQTATFQVKMDALSDRFRAELADARTDIANQMTNQTRTMIFSLLMAIFTVASVVGSLAFAIR
jgi:uncharacterized protein YeaO (DUF488 family)